MKGQFSDYPQYRLLHKTTGLIKEIDRVTGELPTNQLYFIAEKLKASVNTAEKKIEEGYGKESSRDKAKFFIQAQVSIEDSLDALLLAESLKYGDYTELIADLTEVRDLLNLDTIKLIKKPTSRN